MNKQLIKIKTNERGQYLVSARELHEFLESKERFSKWWTKKVNYIFDKDVDYFKTELKINNQCVINYYVTIEMAKYICNKVKCNPKSSELLSFLYSIDPNTEIVIKEQSRFEDNFMNKLEQALIPLDYKLIRQRTVFNNKYRIDGYIEELKIAIEYDEQQHEYQKEEDLIRQQKIEKELKCIFVRCNYKNTDAYNIGLIMKEILVKIKI